MKLNVPYHFTELFCEYINDNQNYINSVYYSLKLTNLGDARYKDSFEFNIPNKALLPNNNINQYIILNARFNNPLVYNDNDIDRLIKVIEYYEATGIVFLDMYLLKYISKRSKEFIKSIDVIPSINTFLDSFDKCQVMIEYLLDMGYNIPSRIVLDRYLNRNIQELSKISRKLQRNNIKIEILANEGCLYQCPYKINHDVLIATSHFDNISSNFNSAENINNFLGCLQDYKDNPYKLLKSPFIRPEDVHYYESFANILKIAGRTKSETKLVEVINAYINNVYDGNLIFLNDSQGGLIDTYYIFNDLFPDDFVEVITNCCKNCNNCQYCQTLFPKISQKLS